MKDHYILVYLMYLLGAIGAFVLGIVALMAKANGGVLGINIGIIDIFGGFFALVALFITYTVLKKKK
ncbi:MAG: hypothetical protein M3Y39_11120 [Chloroflexota bacterium]|nr:hypothetical protein [Chloroflexota bacterium]